MCTTVYLSIMLKAVLILMVLFGVCFGRYDYSNIRQYTFNSAGNVISRKVDQQLAKNIEFAKSRPKRQINPRRGLENPRIVQLTNLELKVVGSAFVWGYKRETNMFLGVPYAKRLEDKFYRFKPPHIYEPNEPSGELMATSFKPLCPQDLTFVRGLMPNVSIMHEDCLYLDIYTPNDTRSGTVTDAKFPVLVFLHGGQFMHGSSRMYSGLVLSRQNLVVVSVSYRVGPFGFLSTEDEASPGNYGVLDIKMALDYIYANIAPFRGDPNKITVIGHEAGAAALGILMISNETREEVRKMVQQVVLMGGSDTSEWAVIPPEWEPKFYAYQLAVKVGCPAPEWDGLSKWVPSFKKMHRSIVDCLRQDKDFRVIARSAGEMGKRFGSPAGPFAPVVDGRLLHAMPRVIRQAESASIVRVNLMAGVCRDAGAYHVQRLNVSNIENGVSEDTVRRVLYEQFVERRRVVNKALVLDSLEFMYTYWPDPYNTSARRQQLIDIYSDTLYGLGPDEAAKDNIKVKTLNKVVTYFYVFGYRSINEVLPWWMGTPHGKDVGYMLGFPYFNSTMQRSSFLAPKMSGKWTPMDYNMSDFMMSLMRRFAVFGNATYKIAGEEYFLRNFSWQPFDLYNRTYGNLDEWSKNYTRYRQQYYGFWRNYWWQLKNQYIVTTQIPSTPASFVAYKASTYSLGVFVAILLLVLLFSCYGIYRKHTKYWQEKTINLRSDQEVQSYAAHVSQHSLYKNQAYLNSPVASEL